jgi:hypothetical protein
MGVAHRYGIIAPSGLYVPKPLMVLPKHVMIFVFD